MTNLLPVDELLTIRQKIKELKAREYEISAGIKSGEMDTHGAFALAILTKRRTKRFDRKAAEAELGDLSRFDVEGETLVLRVEELANPDAA